MSDERTLATEVRELFAALAGYGEKSMANAISSHFQVNVGSEQFFLALASIERKTTQLITDIRASAVKQASQELYVGAVSELRRFVNVSRLDSAKSNQLAASEQAFQYLTLIDDILAPLDHRDVPAETIDGLRSAVNELLDSLRKASVDERLKAFLLANLSNILWAIDNFKAIGIEGLCSTFGMAHAEIARSMGFRGASKPEAKSWFKKAWPALGAIGMTVTTASAVVEKSDNLLTHSESIYDHLTGKPHAAQSLHIHVDAPAMPAPDPSLPALPGPTET
jgi:hypothetical protein